MRIETGRKLPNATLLKRLEDKTHESIEIADYVAGRKVALIGMPGAFTGTCTGDHLPNLIASLPSLEGKGVDEVIVFVVNDPQVVKAWGEVTGATVLDVQEAVDNHKEEKTLDEFMTFCEQ